MILNNKIQNKNFTNSIINNQNCRKKSNDEFSDGIYSHSYMNSMAIPVICGRVVPVQNYLKPIREQYDNKSSKITLVIYLLFAG